MEYPVNNFLFKYKAGLALKCKNDEHLLLIVTQGYFGPNHRDHSNIFRNIRSKSLHFVCSLLRNRNVTEPILWVKSFLGWLNLSDNFLYIKGVWYTLYDTENHVKNVQMQPNWFPAENDVLLMLFIHLVSSRLCLHLDFHMKIYSNVNRAQGIKSDLHFHWRKSVNSIVWSLL